MSLSSDTTEVMSRWQRDLISFSCMKLKQDQTPDIHGKGETFQKKKKNKNEKNPGLLRRLQVSSHVHGPKKVTS
jgi:hypothetical protein